MSELEKPKKRRFWQLHLSTTVALSLVTGMLLYAHLFHVFGVLTGEEADVLAIFGWPFPIFRWRNWDGRVPLMDYSWRTYSRWSVLEAIVADVVISLGFIMMTILVLEWLIRRREARKP